MAHSNIQVHQTEWYSIHHWAMTHIPAGCMTRIPPTNHCININPCQWCRSILMRSSWTCRNKFKNSISSLKPKSKPFWHFLNNNTTTFYRWSFPLLNETPWLKQYTHVKPFANIFWHLLHTADPQHPIPTGIPVSNNQNCRMSQYLQASSTALLAGNHEITKMQKYYHQLICNQFHGWYLQPLPHHLFMMIL